MEPLFTKKQKTELQLLKNTLLSSAQKLLPDLGVDLVLEGHDHVYMRSYPLYNNRVASTKRVELTHNGQKYVANVQPKGLTYVISGTSGVKTYTPKDDNEIAKSMPVPEHKDVSDSQMFSAIHSLRYSLKARP